jgi:hypothetical protein
LNARASHVRARATRSASRSSALALRYEVTGICGAAAGPTSASRDVARRLARVVALRARFGVARASASARRAARCDAAED